MSLLSFPSLLFFSSSLYHSILMGALGPGCACGCMREGTGGRGRHTVMRRRNRPARRGGHACRAVTQARPGSRAGRAASSTLTSACCVRWETAKPHLPATAPAPTHAPSPRLPHPTGGAGLVSLCYPLGVMKRVPLVVHTGSSSLYEEPLIACVAVTLERVQGVPLSAGGGAAGAAAAAGASPLRTGSGGTDRESSGGGSPAPASGGKLGRFFNQPFKRRTAPAFARCARRMERHGLCHSRASRGERHRQHGLSAAWPWRPLWQLQPGPCGRAHRDRRGCTPLLLIWERAAGHAMAMLR